MRMLYLVGEPGVGKTTTLAAVTSGLAREVVNLPPRVTFYEGGALVELGHARDTFGGTDALAMNAQPRVLRALDDYRWPNVVAEGDRLANGKFFDAVRGLGYDLTVAVLTADPLVSSERREGRGQGQNESWVRGRVTKVRNLAQNYSDVLIDAGRPVAQVAADLAAHPVFNDAATAAER